MKDELPDDLPVDAAAQKSVSDWLMQVISGKKPAEQHINGNGQVATSTEPELASKAEAESASAAESAIAAVPVSSESELRTVEFPDTATAEAEPRVAIPIETTADTYRGSEPEAVEAAKSSAAVMDISRGVLPEPQPEAVEMPEREITPLEISRGPEYLAPEPEVSATATEEEISGETEPVTAEPEKIEAEASEEEAEVTEGQHVSAERFESVFARKDFQWGPGREASSDKGETQGADDDAYSDAEKRFPVPKELRDLGARPEGWNAAVKTLLRLGSVVPWLARILPMLEGGVGGEQGTSLAHEVRHEVADLRLVQYELRTAVQDQSLQLKRVEDQLTRIRQSLEPDSDRSELDATVKSTVKLVRLMGIGVGALLLVLIVMVSIIMAHGSH